MEWRRCKWAPRKVGELLTAGNEEMGILDKDRLDHHIHAQ